MSVMQLQHFFDQQADIWDYSTDLQKLKQIQQILKHYCSPILGPVLDIGCGTGVLLQILPQLMSVDHACIVELDLSRSMLQRAKQKNYLGSKKIFFLQADAHHLPLNDLRFTTVIAFQVFPHFERSNQVLKEVGRILKENGRFILLHLMDHERLNALHYEIGKPVQNHYLPPVEILAKQIEYRGFKIDLAFERQDCYLIRAQKIIK